MCINVIKKETPFEGVSFFILYYYFLDSFLALASSMIFALAI